MRRGVAIVIAGLAAVLGWSLAAAQGRVSAGAPPFVPTAVLSTTTPTSTPAPAPAKLAYATGRSSTVVWRANADGSGKQRLGPGNQPLLSPDGAAVAASSLASKGSALRIYAPGSPTRAYFNARRVTATPLSWSPESRYLAVGLTTSNGDGAGLEIVDTQTRTARAIATGAICGASFAPDVPDRLVYGRGPAKSACFLGHSLDIYSAAVDGTGTTKLTHNGRSLNPVWGAGGVAFDVQRARGNNAPEYQIWLMHPDGTHRVQLTHTRVPLLLDGLVPLRFSADGGRLLAEYIGQDTDETWTIQLAGKRARHLTFARQEVRPGGLSGDGTTVLVDSGAFDAPSSDGTVRTLAFTGGSPHLLVRHAAEPSWNR